MAAAGGDSQRLLLRRWCHTLPPPATRCLPVVEDERVWAPAAWYQLCEQSPASISHSREGCQSQTGREQHRKGSAGECAINWSFANNQYKQRRVMEAHASAGGSNRSPENVVRLDRARPHHSPPFPLLPAVSCTCTHRRRRHQINSLGTLSRGHVAEPGRSSGQASCSSRARPVGTAVCRSATASAPADSTPPSLPRRRRSPPAAPPAAGTFLGLKIW